MSLAAWVTQNVYLQISFMLCSLCKMMCAVVNSLFKGIYHPPILRLENDEIVYNGGN